MTANQLRYLTLDLMANIPANTAELIERIKTQYLCDITEAQAVEFLASAKTAVVVKFNSHRARERGLGRLSVDRQDFVPSVYSFRRPTGRGAYIVSKTEFEAMKNISGVSKIKGPFTDLHCCIG